ncbi:hypothetical protein FXV83_05515 [Bradyrhizobium hipponense]|uniref:Uncharacterized protein n=1 Tax=Bradyrhizobium hipponense TaxID=2605638 RepID=A0A5S4YV95_9BRAD|nr:hypothetical protein [Bradyrhizobium hipponense]TYO67437.1 hypothetical protein FXV83_05515 [Bradyrhizobium hipponense]
MFVPVAPVIEEAEEPDVHGAVYAVPEVLGSGTAVIGLSPLVSASVAPSGIVPPTTPAVEVAGWLEEVVLLDVVAQLELSVMPPPSKVEDGDEALLVTPVPIEEVDDVPIAPVEPVALHNALTVGPRPPESISVAPSGTPAPVKLLLVPLEPSVPIGEVAPIAEGPVVVCASLAALAQSSASAATNNRRRIDIS